MFPIETPNKKQVFMQLVLHAGVHFTEADRLMKCLLRNRVSFANHSTLVPGPGKYRRLMRETLNAMSGTHPAPDARDLLLDAMLEGSKTKRLVLSNAHFFGLPQTAVRQGQLYSNAGLRLSQFANLFEHDDVSLFLTIRNPATFLPAALRMSQQKKMEDLLGKRDPREVTWSEMVLRIRAAVPHMPLTVWCNEDNPLIWSRIVREMVGLDEHEQIVGALDLLSEIISPAGMRRLLAFLSEHPNMPDAQQRRVMTAFLDKYGLQDQIEEEIDIPGWDTALIDEMTQIYDSDLAALQAIPDLTLVLP
jgi:hypothetical protein